MSRFSGKQFRGAGRADRATKRAEAEQRAASAIKGNCGHRHTANGLAHCTQAWSAS